MVSEMRGHARCDRRRGKDGTTGIACARTMCIIVRKMG